MFYPETIFVKILVPEKPFLTREKAMLEIPAVDGPYLILPQRAPMIKMMKSGVLRLFETPESEPDIYFVQGGIAKMRNNGCTVLTKRILSLKDLDAAAVKDELEQVHAMETKTVQNDAIEQSQASLRHEREVFLSMVAGYLDKHPV